MHIQVAAAIKLSRVITSKTETTYDKLSLLNTAHHLKKYYDTCHRPEAMRCGC